MTPWIFEDSPVIEIDPIYLGFVYIITQISTGKKYIGKKKCVFKKTSIKTVTLKNGTKKKKKIRSLVPSDWLTYYGSSANLLVEVEKSGYNDFKREIIVFCKKETELSYMEAKLQFESNCLMKPLEYFNEWIMVRTRRDHLIGKQNV